MKARWGDSNGKSEATVVSSPLRESTVYVSAVYVSAVYVSAWARVVVRCGLHLRTTCTCGLMCALRISSNSASMLSSSHAPDCVPPTSTRRIASMTTA